MQSSSPPAKLSVTPPASDILSVSWQTAHHLINAADDIEPDGSSAIFGVQVADSDADSITLMWEDEDSEYITTISKTDNETVLTDPASGIVTLIDEGKERFGLILYSRRFLNFPEVIAKIAPSQGTS